MQAFTEYRTLQLESFDGTLIPNGVGIELDPKLVEFTLRNIDRMVLAAATPLSEPTARYNCHGLVFASRRTNIPPPDADVDIEDLLRRDGYQRIMTAARVGDIAAYRDERKIIVHTGIVCQIEQIGTQPVV